MFEDIFSGGKENLLCTVPLGVTVDSHRLDTITQIEKEKNSQYGVRLSFGISISTGWVPRSLLRKIYSLTEVCHSRTLLAGIQAMLGLDPR